MRTARARALGFLVVAALVAVPGAATQVEIFRTQSREAFLKGQLDGVSVDGLGRLRLAHRAERVTSIDEPFVLSAARHPDGWVLGTGNAGRVLLVDRKGATKELFTADEPEVFAVWVDPDGTVFAGTSPDGKVYRIPAGGGAAEVWFDPGQTYIWALARDRHGSLLVATGTEGKLFRVREKGAKPDESLLLASGDTHVRSLAVLPDGRILAGTAGEGLILSVGEDGSVRTLYDAEQPEVVALTAAADGTAWAALVASEASLVDLQPPAKKTGDDDKGDDDASVSVTAGPPTAGSRRPGAKGPHSVLVRIDPGGPVETLAELADETIYDLQADGSRVWVATGLEGKLYSWQAGDLVLEKDVDERQIVALLPAASGRGGPGGADAGDIAFATTNSSALYRLSDALEKRGTYTSAALDAGSMARFGTFRWSGEAPGASAVRVSFRSGVSAEPDHTWSEWTPAKSGREVALDGVPAGRYVEWRAELVAGSGGDAPVLSAAELSYRQENLPPSIDRFVVLDPGQILVPANFNPTNQVYEPAHPNREGIFTTLEAATGAEDGRLKTLWKRGYRSFRWSVDDPNQDDLVYELAFRPEGGSGWLPVAGELDDDAYSFDATALPDGVYRFRLRASDAPSNEGSGARTAERVSEPVVVDHTPPALAGTTRRGGVLEVRVEDALSPLREAVVSVDAGPWRPVEAADGLLDGMRETLRVEVPEGAHLVLLRVTDTAFNQATYGLEGGGAGGRGGGR